MNYMILWNILHCSTSSLAPYYFHYGDIALSFTYPYLYAYAAYPGHLLVNINENFINEKKILEKVRGVRIKLPISHLL